MDYSGNTLQELYDIYAKIDNEQNPDVAEEIFEEIKRREKEERPPVIGKLAPRLLRFIAFLIDLSIVVLIFCLLFIFSNVTIFDLDLMKIIRGDSNYLMFLFFIAVAIFCLIYFIVNFYWLLRNGQTVGKKITGIKIIDSAGKIPTLGKTFGYRFLIPAFMASLPVFGILLWLMDVLFIFGKKRKCIHDYIADTKVVFAGDEIYF